MAGRSLSVWVYHAICGVLIMSKVRGVEVTCDLCVNLGHLLKCGLPRFFTQSYCFCFLTDDYFGGNILRLLLSRCSSLGPLFCYLLVGFILLLFFIDLLETCFTLYPWNFVLLRLTLNSELSPCLSFPSAGITNVMHHTELYCWHLPAM